MAPGVSKNCPNGIPGHDTFGRVFAMLDSKQFADCFRNWIESLRRQAGAGIVAIGGKTLRRSHDRVKGRQPIHRVSAWARENAPVPGQLEVSGKSSEIAAIPELLRALKLAGCIVTMDAMGCRKQIALRDLQRPGRLCAGAQGQSEQPP